MSRKQYFLNYFSIRETRPKLIPKILRHADSLNHIIAQPGYIGHVGVALHNAPTHQNQSSYDCDMPTPWRTEAPAKPLSPDDGREARICSSK